MSQLFSCFQSSEFHCFVLQGVTGTWLPHQGLLGTLVLILSQSNGKVQMTLPDVSHPARVVSVQWDEVSLMKMRPPCRTWLLPGGSHHLSSLPSLPTTADYTPSHKEVHVILHTVLLLTDWELLPRIIFCLPSFFKHNSRSDIDAQERRCPGEAMPRF